MSTSLRPRACQYCDAPLPLIGDNWHHSATTAYFVILVLCLTALLPSLAFSGKYKTWRASRGASSRVGSAAYLFALLTAIVYLVLTITDIALKETSTLVKGSYLILYIFQAAALLTTSILTLAVLTRFVQESLELSKLRAFNIVKIVFGVLLLLLALAYWALAVVVIAYRLRSSSYALLSSSPLTNIIGLVYWCIYLITLIILFSYFCVGLAHFRQRKAYLATTLLAIGALTISVVFAIVQVFAPYHPNNYQSRASQAYVRFGEVVAIITDLFLVITLLLYLPMAITGAKVESIPAKTESVPAAIVE